MPGINNLSTFLVQGYLFVVILAEWMRPGSRLPRFRLHPAVIFILSFLVLIVAGTWLLSMPEMTTIPGGMPFVDALFTSTSATCVTGLMSVDTMTQFTSKGHWVLLLLIQLGGLNFIAFGSFLALASKFGVAVKQHDVIEDFVNTDNLLGSTGTLGKVVAWCLGLEAVGALAMMATWSSNVPFASWSDRLFSSVFHSVSAFNNAGITLFTDGLAHPWVAQNWLIHWIVTLLVFVGALGMVAMFDLFDFGKLRERMIQPWKTISFPSKIALPGGHHRRRAGRFRRSGLPDRSVGPTRAPRRSRRRRRGRGGGPRHHARGLGILFDPLNSSFSDRRGGKALDFLSPVEPDAIVVELRRSVFDVRPIPPFHRRGGLCHTGGDLGGRLSSRSGRRLLGGRFGHGALLHGLGYGRAGSRFRR